MRVNAVPRCRREDWIKDAATNASRTIWFVIVAFGLGPAGGSAWARARYGDTCAWRLAAATARGLSRRKCFAAATAYACTMRCPYGARGGGESVDAGADVRC